MIFGQFNVRTILIILVVKIRYALQIIVTLFRFIYFYSKIRDSLTCRRIIATVVLYNATYLYWHLNVCYFERIMWLKITLYLSIDYVSWFQNQNIDWNMLNILVSCLTLSIYLFIISVIWATYWLNYNGSTRGKMCYKYETM